MHQHTRQPGMGIADRLLAQFQRLQLGQLAQALVVVGMHGGMRVGVHGRSFRDVGKG
jgi:hypothetical protein